MPTIVMNSVTLRAAAKLELYVQHTEAGLLNKGSCLAHTLGMTKFIDVRDIILVTLCCAT